MDTQRLIALRHLFVLGAAAVGRVAAASTRRRRPPVASATPAQPPTCPPPRRACRPARPVGTPRVPRHPPPHPPARRRRPRGPIVDDQDRPLDAEIDTARRRHPRVAARASTATRSTRPSRYTLLQRTPSASSSRRRGCSATGCRTTRRSTRPPGPRELRARARHRSSQAGARPRRTATRSCRSHVPSRQLPDRRRVRGHERGGAADHALTRTSS